MRVDLTELRDAIRDVPDFPKPGIIFKDITPLLSDPRLFQMIAEAFVLELERDEELGRITKIVGIDARGFILGAALAQRLGTGFVPLRKKGKLPHKTLGKSYTLEYGIDEIEAHIDAFTPQDRVLIVDDLLATGGTAGAAVELLREMNVELAGVCFLVELAFLNGKEKLPGELVRSLIVY